MKNSREIDAPIGRANEVLREIVLVYGDKLKTLFFNAQTAKKSSAAIQ